MAAVNTQEPRHPHERELVGKAKAGDREAFARLYEPIERAIAAFLYRLIADRQDAQDLAQETAVRALQEISLFNSDRSFRSWVFGMAAEAGLSALRGSKPWRPDAVIQASKLATEKPAVRRQLQKLHKSIIHTTYDMSEHVDFCFTAMARALPPHETAALLLTEIHGFSREEAAKVLNVSPQVLHFQVEQARQAFIEIYDGRCGLINKQGSCPQCAVFDTVLHGDNYHTARALFEIGLDPQPTPEAREATFPQRLTVVRSSDALLGKGAKLHEFLMQFTRETNGY